MKLRLGIGKRIGPFFVGATFGGKSKYRKPKTNTRKITYTIKSPAIKSSESAVQKARWRDSKYFWFSLAVLFALSFLYGLFDAITNGFGIVETISLFVLLSLVGLFFKQGTKKRSVSEVFEPDIPATATVMPTPKPAAINSLTDVDVMDGHQFEHWCAELLEQNGFSDVEVTKGSGDQGVDVLAKKGGIRYAVQCKCYSSPLGNKPIQEVNTGKTIYHCQIGAVMTNQTFTDGARAAAEATGVLLWDRDRLLEMIENKK